MFSGCYYLSYKHALREFNKAAVERSEELSDIGQNNSPSPVLIAENIPDNREESIPVDKQGAEIILPSTNYILEIFDAKTNKVETQELNPPGYLVGLSREEVITYLSDYMNDMPLSEHNKGLLSYELVNFSADQIVLRKNYDETQIAFLFYVVVKNGYVVVFNSDMKSIFSYTHIEAKNLPEKDRIDLSSGIYINSKEELFGLLESYSS